MNTDPLPAKQERAAQMVAADAYTDAEIVQDVGIAMETLTEWKDRPTFKACVAEVAREFAALFDSYPIVVLAWRLSEVRRRWDELRQTMNDLVNNPAMAGVLGRRRVREVGPVVGSPGS